MTNEILAFLVLSEVMKYRCWISRYYNIVSCDIPMWVATNFTPPLHPNGHCLFMFCEGNGMANKDIKMLLLVCCRDYRVKLSVIKSKHAAASPMSLSFLVANSQSNSHRIDWQIAKLDRLTVTQITRSSWKIWIFALNYFEADTKAVPFSSRQMFHTFSIGFVGRAMVQVCQHRFESGSC